MSNNFGIRTSLEDTSFVVYCFLYYCTKCLLYYCTKFSSQKSSAVSINGNNIHVDLCYRGIVKRKYFFVIFGDHFVILCETLQLFWLSQNTKQSWLLGYTAVDHCPRCAKIRAFSDPYFVVYGQNCILRIPFFLYTGKHGVKKARISACLAQRIIIRDYLRNKGKLCKIMYNG